MSHDEPIPDAHAISEQIRQLAADSLRYQRALAWLTEPNNAWGDLAAVLLDMQRLCAVNLLYIDPDVASKIGREQGRAHVLSEILNAPAMIEQRRAACEAKIEELRAVLDEPQR